MLIVMMLENMDLVGNQMLQHVEQIVDEDIHQQSFLLIRQVEDILVEHVIVKELNTVTEEVLRVLGMFGTILMHDLLNLPEVY